MEVYVLTIPKLILFDLNQHLLDFSYYSYLLTIKKFFSFQFVLAVAYHGLRFNDNF